jgi:LmbE family N-acetylglucosaminyl deacetylase
MKLILCSVLLAVGLTSPDGLAQKITKERMIMVVVAHPDDEVAVLPLARKYAVAGVNVQLVIATDGQKGVIPNFKVPEGETLAGVREKEARCAAEMLGIRPPLFLNLVDGTLSEFKTLPILKEKLKAVIREQKPDVLITWGPEGGYGHPDHRMVGNVVTEIFQEGCEECPDQLFYPGFPKEINLPLESLQTFGGKFIFNNLHRVQSKFLTHAISFTDDDLKVARKSFGCHQSQFDPKTMDEIFSMLERSKNTIYLRSFNSTPSKSTSVFE